MNPEIPHNPRGEIEAQLTALLLGELPADKAGALRQLMAADPALTELHDRLKATIDLVRETASPAAEPAADAAPLKFSEDRRQKLLASFKTVTPREFTRPRKKRSVKFTVLELVAVVAIMAILAGMLLPALSKAKSKASSIQVRSNLRQVELAKQMWAEENKKSPGDAPTAKDLAPYLAHGQLPQAALGEKYVPGKVGEPVIAELEAAKAGKSFGRFPANSAPGGSRSQIVHLTSDGRLTYADPQASQSQPPAAGMAGYKLRAPVKPKDRDSDSGATANEVPGKGAQRQSTYSTLLAPVQPTPVVPPENLHYSIALPRIREDDTLPDYGIASPPIANDRTSLPRIEPLNLSTSATPSPSSGGEGGRPTGFFANNDHEAKIPPTRELFEAKPPVALTYNFADAADALGTANRDSSKGGSGGGGSGGGEHVGNNVSGVNGTSAAQYFNQPNGDRLYRDRSFATDEIAPSASASPATEKNAVSVDPATGLPVADPEWAGVLDTPAKPGFSGNLFVGRNASVAGNAGESKDRQLSDLSLGVPAAGSFYTELNREDVGGLRSPPHPVSSPDGGENSPKQSSRIETLNPSPGARLSPSPRGEGRGEGVHSTDLFHGEGEREKANGGNSLIQGSNAQQEAEVAFQERRAGVPPAPLPVPEALQEGVEVKAKFAEVVQQDNRALGFDWYEGDKLSGGVGTGGGRVVAQGGTALLTGGQRSQTSVTTPPSISATGTKADGYNANVIKGFSRLGPVASPGNATAGVPVTSQPSDNAGEKSSTNLYSVQVVGYIKLNTNAGFALVTDPPAILGETASDTLNLQSANTHTGGSVVNSGTLKTTLESPVKYANSSDISDGLEVLRRHSNEPASQKVTNSLEEAAGRHLETRADEAQLEQLRVKLAEQRAKEETVSNLADAPVPHSTTTPLIPQPEVQTADNAFSTFSLNVADVSFKLAEASLEKGVMPDAGSIRSEEFINAFDYRDPKPPTGAPIAFAWERAQYPFAQNRDLVRFAIKTAAEGRQSGCPLNLVLLLDNSGSMERADRVRIIHEALRVLAAQLQPQDRLSIVTFARTATLRVDGIAGDGAARAAEVVDGLTPEGGTNLEEAMKLAYETASRHYLLKGMNRVVMLTDGAANLGNVDPETLKQTVEANRKQGIALDCFGIGWEGYNDDLLEVLTRNGDGRYGFINSPEQAAAEFATQLAGALHVAASDVKVQVEFNSTRVSSWRQIGYAKHQLKKEQFRDNTVDAAEIAAEEEGNALYTVEVNPQGQGPLGIVRVRYKVPGTTEYHEHEFPLPYTGNAAALDQSAPTMRLAATAAAFSEWLASSPFAAEVTPGQLLRYLDGVPQIYGADTRPKTLETMIRQAKSLAGK